MRVLVFGSSSAEGFWDPKGGWAARLRQYYDQQKIDDFSKRTPWVSNLGISGDTVTDIMQRFVAETEMRLKEGRSCCFIFHVGSNDAVILNGEARSPVETYQERMRDLISQAYEYSKRVLVLGFHAIDESKTNPVPWADMHYKNKNIMAFENAAKKVSNELGARFVPVHQHFREKIQEGESLLAQDGLHPNDAGHQLIFELVRPAVDNLLGGA